MRAVVSTVLLVAALAACGGGGSSGDDDGGAPGDATEPDAEPSPPDALVIPVLRNPVALPDAELAAAAVAILGTGASKNCDRCHALTQSRFQSWETESSAVVASCLTNVAPTTQAEAMQIVNCLRVDPNIDTSDWSPANLGIYATAAGLDWFEYVFILAYGADEGVTQLGYFRDQVWMPRSDSGALSQPDFDIVAEWFARGLPSLGSVVAGDPPVQTCTTTISPDVQSHVTAMATQGWRAVNEDNGILMFGCAGATDPQQCLTAYPAASANAFSAGWPAAMPSQTMRLLHETTISSAFWTRSSADGRFVSFGGSNQAMPYRSTVVDLTNGAEIPAAALYDPGFFPDNSGFALQGGGARFCLQSLLTAGPSMITFNESQCITTNAVGLYQHLGAVAGGDYWTVDGQYSSDNGGHSVTGGDVSANFDPNASIDLTPFVNSGLAFQPQPKITKPLPYEGDTVMSPNGKLLISRVRASSTQTVLILRKVVATPSGSTYEIDVPEIARYCMRGGKPGISLDDRWMVIHHYVESGDWASLGYASATDPGFVALRAEGAANVFLVDLLTGTSTRITTMGPGQYALYPHFRSDGWIYFTVRDRLRDRENIVASDAALVLEE